MEDRTCHPASPQRALLLRGVKRKLVTTWAHIKPHRSASGFKFYDNRGTPLYNSAGVLAGWKHYTRMHSLTVSPYGVVGTIVPVAWSESEGGDKWGDIIIRGEVRLTEILLVGVPPSESPEVTWTLWFEWVRRPELTREE